jgi:hypothetical protein
MFLAAQNPPDGALISVALRPDCTLLGDFQASVAFDRAVPPGEVPWTEVEAVFASAFHAIAELAAANAKAQLEQILADRKKRREASAAVLREDASRYRTDRLVEIDREQKLAEAAEEKATAQILLFEQREATGFKARRAAVDTFHRRRMEEIEAFVQGEDSPAIHPLGAVLIFPT